MYLFCTQGMERSYWETLRKIRLAAPAAVPLRPVRHGAEDNLPSIPGVLLVTEPHQNLCITPFPAASTSRCGPEELARPRLGSSPLASCLAESAPGSVGEATASYAGSVFLRVRRKSPLLFSRNPCWLRLLTRWLTERANQSKSRRARTARRYCLPGGCCAQTAADTPSQAPQTRRVLRR